MCYVQYLPFTVHMPMCAIILSYKYIFKVQMYQQWKTKILHFHISYISEFQLFYLNRGCIILIIIRVDQVILFEPFEYR